MAACYLFLPPPKRDKKIKECVLVKTQDVSLVLSTSRAGKAGIQKERRIQEKWKRRKKKDTTKYIYIYIYKRRAN